MILVDRDRKLMADIHRMKRAEGRAGPLAGLSRLRGKLGYTFWSLVAGCDISRAADVAEDTRFPHPSGVVIHADAVVEPGCLIMQQVTLGQVGTPGAPRICRDCYIGAGAKILGPITVGAGARIGANAVVLEDVPAGATAVGVPAKIVKSS